MDKAQRLAALRACHKALAGPFRFHGYTPKRRRWTETRPFQFVYPMGFQGGPGYGAQWVTEADAKAPVEVRTARTAKESPLGAIARQLPAKLPVVPLPR